MASYTVNRAKSATLGIATVDTVTFPASYPYNRVRVINRDGTNPIYFTVNGATPTVAGDDVYVVDVHQSVVASFQGGPVLLIAAAAAAYTVQAE